MKRTLVAALLTTIAIVLLSSTYIAPVIAQGGQFQPSWKYGGYVDEVVFKVIYDESARVLALRKGEIDFIQSPYPISPELLPELADDPNIKLVSAEDAGFQHIALHNDVFPTNITEFRRAIAYAIDKKFIAEVIWKWAKPIDTPVPPIYGDWSLEDQIGGEFYEKNVAKAKAELAKGGFVDVDGDGWVEYDPDRDGVGADLNGDGIPNDDVEVEVLTPSTPTARARTGMKIAEDLRDVGIKATARVTDFATVILTAIGTRETHKPWTLALWGWGLGRIPDHVYHFSATGATWNEYIYHSSDPEFDAVAKKIVTAPTKGEAMKAVHEATELFMERMFYVPYLTTYLIHAHRVDKYEGWINQPGAGLGGTINLYGIRPIGGGFGGTVTTTIITAPAGTNILAVSDYYSLQYLELVYDFLYTLDPTTFAPPDFEELVPVMADSITPEKVYDASLGHDIWKITIKLIENATWHDGVPVTADDVVFSYEIINFTMPELWGFVVETWINTTKVDDHTVIVYGDTPSYTRFWDLISPPLLPKHIWGDPATYGKASWDEVTPEDVLAFDPAAEGKMIGCGPFKWKDYVPGEVYVLEVYEKYPYSVRNWPEVFGRPGVAPVGPAAGPAAGPISPEEIVVAGETFEPDTYTALTVAGAEVTYEPVLAGQSTTLFGLAIGALIVGAAVAVATRKK